MQFCRLGIMVRQSVGQLLGWDVNSLRSPFCFSGESWYHSFAAVILPEWTEAPWRLIVASFLVLVRPTKQEVIHSRAVEWARATFLAIAVSSSAVIEKCCRIFFQGAFLGFFSSSLLLWPLPGSFSNLKTRVRWTYSGARDTSQPPRNLTAQTSSTSRPRWLWLVQITVEKKTTWWRVVQSSLCSFCRTSWNTIWRPRVWAAWVRPTTGQFSNLPSSCMTTRNSTRLLESCRPSRIQLHKPFSWAVPADMWWRIGPWWFYLRARCLSLWVTTLPLQNRFICSVVISPKPHFSFAKAVLNPSDGVQNLEGQASWISSWGLWEEWI